MTGELSRGDPFLQLSPANKFAAKRNKGKGTVSRSPPFPNRTCGFPAYGSPPVSPSEQEVPVCLAYRAFAGVPAIPNRDASALRWL